MNDTIKNGATATGVNFSFPGTNTRITGFSKSDDRISYKDFPILTITLVMGIFSSSMAIHQAI